MRFFVIPFLFAKIKEKIFICRIETCSGVLIRTLLNQVGARTFVT
jgi:hypothetical protein